MAEEGPSENPDEESGTLPTLAGFEGTLGLPLWIPAPSPGYELGYWSGSEPTDEVRGLLSAVIPVAGTSGIVGAGEGTLVVGGTELGVFWEVVTEGE